MYDVGDVVRLYTSTPFTDISGNEFDPDTVTFHWRRQGEDAQVKVYPDDAEVVQTAVGSFHIDLELDTAGQWYYRVEGAASNGALRGAAEGALKVRHSRFND